MLVLTRKVDQDLYIADDLIRVVVLGVDGNRVRLGIDAPKDISILRGEARRRQQQAEPHAPGMDEPSAQLTPTAEAASQPVGAPIVLG